MNLSLTSWSFRFLIVLTISGALMLPGCIMIGPDYQAPEAPVARNWLDLGEKSSRQSTDHRAWWHVFHDQVLNRLIEIACEQNLTLMSAGTRVLQARA